MSENEPSEAGAPSSLAGMRASVVVNPSAIGDPAEDPVVFVGADLRALLNPCACGGVNGFHAEGCQVTALTGQGDVAGRLVETAAARLATSVNPNCPWFDKAPEDQAVYREDARRMLAAVLPLLADEIRELPVRFSSGNEIPACTVRGVAVRLLRDLAVRVAR